MIIEIQLKNPITKTEVNLMIQNILNASSTSTLLINFGDHHFESIDVIKYCKVELKNIESILTHFPKIAMLSIPPYKNESPSPNKLSYFNDKRKATQWLLTTPSNEN